MEEKEEITALHAIVLPLLSSGNSASDYIKAISSMIGSRNIYGVIENNCHVKIYFKNLADVDRFVKYGLFIMGQHVSVDYNVTKGIKVRLSNIDPVISNDDIKQLLSPFGTFESDVIFEQFSSENEYSHIKGSSRYVYMTIHDTQSFPCNFNLTFNGMQHKIDVTIERQNQAGTVNGLVPDHVQSNTDCFKVEIVDEDENNSNLRRKKSVKSFARVKKALKYKYTKKNSLQARMANRIVRNAKRNNKTPENSKAVTNKKRRVKKSSRVSKGSIPNVLMIRPSSLTNSVCSDFLLDENQFRDFLHKVRYHRAPLEIVEEFLGDIMPQTLRKFISQLHHYYQNSKDNASKIKFSRLIKVCSASLNGLKMPTLSPVKT